MNPQRSKKVGKTKILSAWLLGSTQRHQNAASLCLSSASGVALGLGSVHEHVASGPADFQHVWHVPYAAGACVWMSELT